MSETEMAGALRDTLWVVIKLGGPLLVVALVVGLVVSLFQAVTQINEPTLVFVPSCWRYSPRSLCSDRSWSRHSTPIRMV